MNKIVTTIIVLLISVSTASAQKSSNHIARVEGDLSLGLAFPTATNKDYNYVSSSLHYGSEVRYNFQKLPLDLGLGLLMGSVGRANETSSNRNINFLYYLSSDYNFRQMKKVSIFTGVGMGYSRLINYSSNVQKIDELTGLVMDENHGGSFCVMPRVGVEFWHRLRVTCYYQIQKAQWQRLGVSVGFVFGGGVRK